MVTLTHKGGTDNKWTLDIATAKELAKVLKGVSKGSYEYRVIVLPIRQAVRAKQSEVSLYTEGFGTSAVAQILNANNINYVQGLCAG